MLILAQTTLSGYEKKFKFDESPKRLLIPIKKCKKFY